jgi:vancomycin resistance protein YoaR
VPAGRSRRRPLLIVAALVAVLALVYVADLFLSSGSVPRGATVAGVQVGGLSLADAEQRLRTEIEPRTTVPVEVTVGEVSTQIDPTTAGLAVDWAGTLARAGEQPLNPITRITSFFTQRELGVATTVDRAAVDGALGELGPIVDRLPVEGTVRFEGTTPVAVDPVPGQQLDKPAAVDVLARDWASGRPVALPLIPLPALTTAEDVATAIEDVAGPAVSGPVTVIGEGGSRGTLTPDVIAAALSFEPRAEGGLEPVLNPTVVTDALDDQLEGSEREAVDARLDFSTNPATVVPSQDGRGVDYDATLADLLTVLTGTGPREITAVYADQPADVTTEELQALGTAGVISEFQTGGFAADSGQNIRRAAELIDGTVVAPGETFSLDAATGPRTAANGYVEAGVIDNGQPGRGIAGGVSQVSTTLFNAAYFAGMTDVRHQAHSFYISRYPPGREATIATGAIDMQFRNDTPTAVLIQTVWTPSSVTVRLLGTKYYDVESLTGPRTAPTSPNTVNVPAGEPCNPSGGAPGFTITDTRRLTDVRTGEVRTDPTTTTRYNPSPQVVCG